MKTTSKIASVAGALALAAAPAFAHGTPPTNPGSAHRPATAGQPSTLPGPSSNASSKAKAYGTFCKDQSKLRSQAAPNTKGTPFSQCVTAMAKAAHTTAPTTTTSEQKAVARSACKGLSKKHVAGQSGTAFSKCVNGAAKLLKTLHS
jgi:DNA-binding NarL/FixJ family response regulator